MSEIFTITKGTKKVIIAMTFIVLTGIGIAYIYFSGINKSEDPRVVDAKLKYEKYNILIKQNDIQGVLSILDTIELIYSQFDDYKNSYEVGVLYNNRASVYLNQALYTTDSIIIDSLLELSLKNVNKSIEIYENWLNKFGKMNKDELTYYFSPVYETKNELFIDKRTEKYLNKRVKDIILAQKETPRRLSVSYTNLGIIMRHKLDLDSAISCYILALELWPDNLGAENNLNILLGKPIKERTFFQKLFPKEK